MKSTHYMALAATMTTVMLFAPLGREAKACTPPEFYAEPGQIATIRFVPDRNGEGGAVPRNAGILFEVIAASDLSEQQIADSIAVEVRRGDVVVPGTVRRVTTDAGQRMIWRWLATDGELSPGNVHVSLFAKIGTTTTLRMLHERDVLVSERQLAVPKLPLSLELKSQLVADGSAPAIQCTLRTDTSTCPGMGDHRGDRIPIATRARAVPVVHYRFANPPSGDQPYLRHKIELFGRNRSGEQSPVDVQENIMPSGGLSQLERPFDEYCVKLTTRFLGDGSEVVDEVCQPLDLDLTVSEDRERAWIKTQLTQCETAEYPEGTSADDPTGSDGCSIASSAPGHRTTSLSAIAIAIAALGGLLVARRRAIRRSYRTHTSRGR